MYLVLTPGYRHDMDGTLHFMMKNLIPLLSGRIQTEFAPLETGLRAFAWMVPHNASRCSTSSHHHHPLLQKEAREKGSHYREVMEASFKWALCP